MAQWRNKRDYYTVLGVRKNTEEADLKRAFRDLARKYHPDMNSASDSEERFKEINEAYAVLSDPSSRARYDRGGFASVWEPGGGPKMADVGAIIEELISEFRRKRRARLFGRDFRYTLEVSFEEAALGCEKDIALPNDVSDQSPPRLFSVKLPAGTKDGAVRTLKAQGEPGLKSSGNLHVVVRVMKHELFSRRGFDVHSEQKISFAQAALGAVIAVATIAGPVSVRIPAGTQSGSTFRLRSRGILKNDGSRGDQLVKVLILVPESLSDTQKFLLAALAKEEGVFATLVDAPNASSTSVDMDS